MGKNLVRKIFTDNGSWVAPAGVKSVRVRLFCSAKKIGAFLSGYGVRDDGYNSSSAWGSGGSGELGDGTTIGKSMPVVVAGGLQWVTVASGGSHALGLAKDGRVFTWGFNASGQLGEGTVTSRSAPGVVTGALKYRDVFGSNSVSYFIDVSGNGYACGAQGTFGRLGDGTLVDKSTPTLIAGSNKFKAIVGGGANGAGLTEAGAIVCWGSNNKGQLGDGTTVPKSSPVVVVGGRVFKEVAGGDFTLGITTNGDMYAWGNNDNGQLGDGTVVSKSSPVLVLGGLKFKKCSISNTASYGLTESGDIYAWGRNLQGQLGAGTTVAKSSPVLVTGGIKFVDLQGFYGLSEGACLGLSESGDIYAWGNNGNGALGNNSNVSQSVPVIVIGAYRYQTAQEELINERQLDVVPGTTYAVKIYEATAKFEREVLGPSYGRARVIVEYFA